MTNSFPDPVDLDIGISQEEADQQLSEFTSRVEAHEQHQAKVEEQERQDALKEKEQNKRIDPDRGTNLFDIASDSIKGVDQGLNQTAAGVLSTAEMAYDWVTGSYKKENEEGRWESKWDDYLLPEDDPVKYKTWWGDAVEWASHIVSTAVIPIPGAKVVGATKAARIGRVMAHRVKILPNITRALPRFSGGHRAASLRGVAKGAITGAKFDALSPTSMEHNLQGNLKNRFPFLDTPFATQEEDHPHMMKFKNVTEGIQLGTLLFEPVFNIVGGGAKYLTKGLNKKTGKVVEQVVTSTDVAAARQASVDDQIAEKAAMQLELPGFGAYKNKKVAGSHQGNTTSLSSLESAGKNLDRIRKDWGSEDGSAGSVTSQVEVERIAKSSGEARKVVKGILKRGVSENYFKQLDETAARQGIPKDVYYARQAKLAKEIYEGRNTSDIDAEEFWELVTREKVKRSGSVEYDFVAGEMAPVIDIVNGTLIKEIRDSGIAGRELQNIFNLRDQDGPAQQLVEKLIAGLRLRAIQKAELSQQFRELGDRATRRQIDSVVDANVQQSIDAFRLALELEGDGGDELFKTIFEGISMAKGVHTLDDFDAFMRFKMKGGRWKGGEKETGALIKELGTMFTHSVLSGPKTAARAIMGTSSATFLRPMSQIVGASMTGDWKTARGGLAALNAMRETLPESFDLFKQKLNSYWAGDISTMKTRFFEKSKIDDQWAMYGHWAETKGSKWDKGWFGFANMIRSANDSRWFTYSTKIMAATDDAFGLIIARARSREKALLQVMDEMPDGKFINLDETAFKKYEANFNADIFDEDGMLKDSAANFAKREATLTQDLDGFSKKLENAFNTTPWARPFFLFARTGVNGLKLTAKNTPGFNFFVEEFNQIARAKPGMDLTELNKYGIETAQDLANAKAVQTGRVAMGSLVLTMAATKFLSGELHGNGATDREVRQARVDAGWKPRTIKLGGQWVSYDAFEPYNQILALVGDIGDHMELMGEEWAEDRFQKLSMALASTITSKSYLAGLQSFVDLFSGAPGKQNSIAANLFNNTLPLSSLRNEIGKVLTPYTRELGSDMWDSIRNRNLISENFASEPLPIKYDLLTGDPIKDHNFMVRMFNMFSPVQFNLDYSPGRQFLFNSGYDIRTSTYSAPDGTDLSNSPRVRSLFQKAIGDQNLLKELEKMAEDPSMMVSIAQMEYHIKSGDIDRKLHSYPHIKRLTTLFNKAKKKAWADINSQQDVQKLLLEEREKKVKNYMNTKEIQDKILNLPSK